MIVSCFLITAGILVVMQLFNTALTSQKKVESTLIAANLAERILAESRLRAATSWPPTPFIGIDPNTVGFIYRVDVVQHELYSPCSTLELAYPAAQRRALEKSAYRVKVTVSWSTTSKVSVTTMIGRPPEPNVVLTVTPLPGNPSPLMPYDVARFRCDATSGGVPVDDILCTWSVVPDSANGSLYLPDRTGTTCGFEHAYRNPRLATPTFFDLGSFCKLEVNAVCNGAVVNATTASLALDKP